MSQTIVAPATALVEQPIGIIRISGDEAYQIACQVTHRESLKPRHAHLVDVGFKDRVDQAVVIYFKAPHSFTGEDVVEIQMHGNPFLMKKVISDTIYLGAVAAKPGEFSLRAFQNAKITLVQAESIADLIHAKSEKAALSASRSLQGAFCTQIFSLQDHILSLRSEVESIIDFDEDDIPTLSTDDIKQRLVLIQEQIRAVRKTANSGVRLSQSIEAVLVGRPNAGKSTLMNALCQDSVAIITDQAGTTRDLITRDIICEGIPIRITDTAGLRESDDLIEKEGIHRAKDFIQKADLVILLSDELPSEEIPSTSATIWRVHNKVDLGMVPPHPVDFKISAKTGEGLDELQKALADFATESVGDEATFSARMRHVQALDEALDVLEHANELTEHDQLAQALMIAHYYLGQAVGETTPDDVLAKIFSTFCVGK